MDSAPFWKKLNWKHLAVLAFIFLLAFGIRAYLFKYDLMFEFDTYWHTRMTEEVILHGAPPAIDPLAYYQLPNGSPIPLTTILFWQVGAFFYYIAALLFTGSLAFSKPLLISVVKFLPAFYGAVTCVLLYFLGSAAYDRKTGYVMAFFGAVSASFLYRTMAGFYEAGGLGHIWLVLGLIFLVRLARSLDNRRDLAKNCLLAGISFGLLSMTYGIFQALPVIIGFFLVFFGFDLLIKRGLQTAGLFVGAVVASFVIFFLVSLFGPNGNWLSDSAFLVLHNIGRLSWLGPVLVLIVALTVVGFLFFAVRSSQSTDKKDTERVQQESIAKALRYAKMILLYLILAGALVLALTPKSDAGIYGQIGEESPGYLYFAHKFNALIIFPVLMLLLVPLVEFRRKNVDFGGLLLFGYVLLSFYMAFDRLHYSYNFGVPLAISVGYVFFYALEFFKKKEKTERKIVGIGLLFMLFVGVSSATIFAQQNTPTIEQNTGWKEGLQWLSKNTPVDAKMFNWWDEGHWITFIGERKVITDNRNFDQQANSDVGKFTTTEDRNEAFAILKKYDSDYLVLGADLFAKRYSMVVYGYYIDNPVDQQDPRFDIDWGANPPQQLQSFSIPCNESSSASGSTIVCGGNSFPKATFETIPTAWTSTPTSLENQRNPIFLYRSKDNKRLIKFSAKVNNSVFGKIWMHSPEMAGIFEEVFPDDVQGYTEKEFKVFKVNKEKLAGN